MVLICPVTTTAAGLSLYTEKKDSIYLLLVVTLFSKGSFDTDLGPGGTGLLLNGQETIDILNQFLSEATDSKTLKLSDGDSGQLLV